MAAAGFHAGFLQSMHLKFTKKPASFHDIFCAHSEGLEVRIFEGSEVISLGFVHCVRTALQLLSHLVLVLTTGEHGFCC